MAVHEVTDENTKFLAAIVIDCAANTPDETEDEHAFHLRLQIVDILLRHFLDFRILICLDETVQ